MLSHYERWGAATLAGMEAFFELPHELCGSSSSSGSIGANHYHGFLGPEREDGHRRRSDRQRRLANTVQAQQRQRHQQQSISESGTRQTADPGPSRLHLSTPQHNSATALPVALTPAHGYGDDHRQHSHQHGRPDEKLVFI